MRWFVSPSGFSQDSLVDGHSSFGNIDGGSAAAMRYTESRLAVRPWSFCVTQGHHRLAVQLRESPQEPVVLPARFPNLLVNGSQGIAVGMATNILPIT